MLRCDYCGKTVNHSIDFDKTRVQSHPVSHFGIHGVFCSDKCRIAADKHSGLHV